MDRAFYATLPARGVLEVAGADRIAFLQGLVSNDVAKADPAHAVFAALLLSLIHIYGCGAPDRCRA